MSGLFAPRRMDGVLAFSVRVLLGNTPACPGPHRCGGYSRRICESSRFWPHARTVRAGFPFGFIARPREYLEFLASAFHGNGRTKFRRRPERPTIERATTPRTRTDQHLRRAPRATFRASRRSHHSVGLYRARRVFAGECLRAGRKFLLYYVPQRRRRRSDYFPRSKTQQWIVCRDAR